MTTPDPHHPLDDLVERRHAVEDLLTAVERRRTALARRGEAFATPADLTGVPDGLARELRTLVDSLVADLDAQIADLEADLETVDDLQSALESTPDDADVHADLLTHAEAIDDALERKGASVEDLLETADRLIDRLDGLVDRATED